MIDWIPVDILSRVFVELLEGAKDFEPAVAVCNVNSPVPTDDANTSFFRSCYIFHAVNPRQVSWKDIHRLTFPRRVFPNRRR